MKKLLLCLLVPSLLFGQTQIGEDIDGEAEGDLSGNKISLSADGATIAIGAIENDGNGEGSGHVRVFSNINGDWIQLGENINGLVEGDKFGSSVSLSRDGSIVAARSIFDSSGFGHVRIFKFQNGDWIQLGENIDQNTVDNLLDIISLSGDGNRIVVGSLSGDVRVFEFNTDNWIQIGADSTNDIIGRAVSMSNDGSIIAVSSPTANEARGVVKILRYDGNDWLQIGEDIVGENIADRSGQSGLSLSFDGNFVAIGATMNNGSDNSSGIGHVRIYQNINNEWVQLGQDIDGETENDASGWSVSISDNGDIVAVGAIFNDGNGNMSGHARIYKLINNIWEQIGQDIDGEAEGDNFGESISLSSDGSIVAIGTGINSGAFPNAGHVQVYDLSAILSTPENNTTQFNLYPNPASSQVTLQFQQNDLLEKVSIYNNLGQLVNTSNRKAIDTSQLSTGVYFVKIKTDQGEGIQKLIIE